MTRAPLARRLVLWSATLGVAACASDNGAAPLPPPQDASRSSTVEQLARPARGVEGDAAIDMAAGQRPSAGIPQIPGDRTARDDAAPEVDLVATAGEETKKADAYRMVVAAWEAIRARGQQPTPDLLAQAIGPENLSLFLTSFHDAERIFRGDVDSWPMAPPDAAPPPMRGGEK